MADREVIVIVLICRWMILLLSQVLVLCEVYFNYGKHKHIKMYSSYITREK